MEDQLINPIKVGVLGLGRSGWFLHCLSLASMPERYQIVAVADESEPRRAEAAAAFGCRTFERVEDLIADPEPQLVVVATPSHLHAAHAMAALRTGKHVVSEKPMATSVADADEMIATAARFRCVLTSFQNYRFTPVFLQIQRVIASGALGRIIEIGINFSRYNRRWDWQTSLAHGGGDLNNQAIHYIDMAMQLLGGPAQDVFAHRSHVLCAGDAEDHVGVFMKSRRGVFAKVEISNVCTYPPKVFTIIGHRGTLTGSREELSWKTSNVDELPPRQQILESTPDRSYNVEPFEFVESTWNAGEEIASEAAYYVALHEALSRGAEPPVTAASVRALVYLLDRCRQIAPVMNLSLAEPRSELEPTALSRRGGDELHPKQISQ